MKNFIIGGLLFTLSVFLFPLGTSAQDEVALTITPPLIKNNISPGQIWKSAIKVVNNNKEDLDVYIQVMDFKGGTETGTVNFLADLPEGEEGDEYLLSRWINIDPGPISIPANESKTIPFIVDVSDSASPGGHYAAIMVGTRPNEEELEGSAAKVSSLLSSLLLLNVKGDVKEEGKIRDFSTEKYVNNKADINFAVRFENSGNVHLQPQGEIRIFDMYGKDQGRMTLNHNTAFGNVLPEETRKWDFNWQGDDSLWSMGRYRASLVIGFGDTSYQTDTRELYFWVVDFLMLGIVVGGFLFVLILIILSIRFYIRRAIRLTQQEVDALGLPETHKNRLRIQVDGQDTKVVDLKAPSAKKTEPETEIKYPEKSFSLWQSLIKMFVWMLVIALLVFAVIFFLNRQNKGDTQESEKIEDVVESKEEGEREENVLSEENVDLASSTKEKEEQGETESKETVTKSELSIVVLNGSGRPGLAGKAKNDLAGKDFPVLRLGNANNFNYDKTIIRYKKDMENFAKEIMSVLKVEAELEENNQLEEEILVVLGADY